MASDMFLKLDGVDGESKDSSKSGQIDILSWGWGVSNASSFHTGTGGGVAKSSFTDITITKHVDKSTPKLMYFCSSGKHIDTATITVRKAGEDPLEYLVIGMEDVFVSSVTSGAHQGEEKLTESISLNFAKITVDYKTQSDEGGGDGPATFSWNIPANAKE